MPATPDVGDTVIIRRDLQVFDILDVASNEVLARRGTFNDALVVAAQCAGIVWQQGLDRRGRYFGDPITVLPRPTMNGPATPRAIRRSA